MLYTYSFSGSSSNMGPSFSIYWLKAVSMTAGFVHTALIKILIFCDTRHGRWYLIAQLLVFTAANTSCPVVMAMQQVRIQGKGKWVNFHPPFSECPSFFLFFLIPQILKWYLISLTLQKFTPHFKILDPPLPTPASYETEHPKS